MEAWEVMRQERMSNMVNRRIERCNRCGDFYMRDGHDDDLCPQCITTRRKHIRIRPVLEIRLPNKHRQNIEVEYFNNPTPADGDEAEQAMRGLLPLLRAGG